MARTALVTGGTRGIGAAICKALKEEGYNVAASYANNHEVAEKFTKDTGIKAYSFNVADFDECKQSVEKIAAELGSIDVLVNNAGITRDGMFHKMSPDAWKSVLDTNLLSCYNMSQAVFSGMRDRGYGRIINISSINGQEGQFGQTNYAAAKAGMLGFTRALALEGARKGVTVNAIAPGYIGTEMVSAIKEEVLEKIIAKIPVARLGKPEEIARAVIFLADEKAGFITGETLSVNGGQHRS